MSEASTIAVTWWTAQVNARSTNANLDALTVALEQACNERIDAVGECHLEVNFNPDGTLREVCKVLEPKHEVYSFPLKTRMRVTLDSVVVKQDGKYQRLFGETQWQVVHYDAGGNRTMLYNGTNEVAAHSMFTTTTRECKKHRDVDVYLLKDGNILEGYA